MYSPRNTPTLTTGVCLLVISWEFVHWIFHLRIYKCHSIKLQKMGISNTIRNSDTRVNIAIGSDTLLRVQIVLLNIWRDWYNYYHWHYVRFVFFKERLAVVLLLYHIQCNRTFGNTGFNDAHMVVLLLVICVVHTVLVWPLLEMFKQFVFYWYVLNTHISTVDVWYAISSFLHYV